MKGLIIMVSPFNIFIKILEIVLKNTKNTI